MPGVLIAEALAQTSGLLLAFSDKLSGKPAPERPPMYYLASSAFKFTHPATPGQTLLLRAVLAGQLGSMHNFEASALVGDTLVAKGSLTLALMPE